MALPSVPLLEVVAGIVALALLAVGASTTVSRSLALARRYDVPDPLLALSVVAIGTSLPEIAAHVTASAGILTGALFYEPASAAALGGSVGSSTVQQLLLVGLVLVASDRVTFSNSFLRVDYLAMLVSFALLYLLAMDRVLTRFDGLLLLVAFAGYVVARYAVRGRGGVPDEPQSENVALDAALTVVGLVVVVLSAFVVLEVIQGFVVRRGLGGSTIGVVTIGLVAALPELSTSLVAVRRDRPEFAFGTLVGSNVVNSLLAVGVGAAISTYLVPPVLLAWDLPFKFLAGLALFAYLRFVSDRTAGRPEGLLLVLVFVAYAGGRLLLYTGQ